MKVKLEIEKEYLDFLLDLKKELETQDNRFTRDPVFQVRHRVREYGFDSAYSDQFVWVDAHGDAKFDEDQVEDLIEYLLDHKDDYSLDEMAFREKSFYRENCLEECGFHRCYYRLITEIDQTFLTEKAAKRYLEINGHNVPGEKFIYAKGTFKNLEIEQLRKFLLSLPHKQ